MKVDEEQYLAHYGILGMKWGKRKAKGKIISKRKQKISNVEKAFDKDINSFKPYVKTGMKNKKGKVLVSAKDVEETIKQLNKIKSQTITKINAKYDKRVKALDKDINSFKPYVKTGIKNKKGKVLVSAKDVVDIVRALEKEKEKYL